VKCPEPRQWNGDDARDFDLSTGASSTEALFWRAFGHFVRCGDAETFLTPYRQWRRFDALVAEADRRLQQMREDAA